MGTRRIEMDTALLKLKQLLNSRYGMGLELRRLMDLSKLKVDSEPVVQGNDLYIPIVVQEQFLGAAIIPHGWELSSDKKRSIAQLVRMVLEPKLYTEYLERRESNIDCLREFDFSPDNVSLFGEDENSELTSDDIFGERDQEVITSVLHLYGPNASLIKKVALQIHEFSARWAFVPFEDICKDLHSAADLCNLGGMTIFVDNLENLSSEHQQLMLQYLETPRSLSEPLILTSSTLSLAEISTRLVNSEFNQIIQTSNLEIERAPLNSQMLRELLDLFFHRDENQDLH